MDELSLDADAELSWETRLATIGRMLDRQPEPLPTLTITVMRRGIVLQRAPVAAFSMTAVPVRGAPPTETASRSPSNTTPMASLSPPLPAIPNAPRPLAVSTPAGANTTAAPPLPTWAVWLRRWLRAGRGPTTRTSIKDWV